MTDLQLVLASQSPRRRNLLERLSIRPSIEPADVDETPEPEERPEAYVERLARTKASASLGPGRVVIAADTVVVRDGVILGKPRDRADAIDILRSLSGRSHQVLSGVAVAVTDPDGSSRVATGIESSVVQVEPLSEDRIDWYLSTGEADDKAGAYGLQGAAGLFADRVEGSVNNVIGLPLTLLDRLFGELGLDLLSFADPSA